LSRSFFPSKSNPTHETARPDYRPGRVSVILIAGNALDSGVPANVGRSDGLKTPGPGAGYRLLSGIDGDTVYDLETGIDKLADQISTTIDWAACLESCRAAGAVAALELGPGTTLSHMASALFPDGRARAVQEFRTLAGLRTWLQRAMGLM
jgi:hypothetical protein